jgi:hypothetical protein
MQNHNVIVIEKSTKEIVHRIKCSSLREQQKVISGMSINLNTEMYDILCEDEQ